MFSASGKTFHIGVCWLFFLLLEKPLMLVISQMLFMSVLLQVCTIIACMWVFFNGFDELDLFSRSQESQEKRKCLM